jgi:WD40 repeat protein
MLKRNVILISAILLIIVVLFASCSKTPAAPAGQPAEQNQSAPAKPAAAPVQAEPASAGLIGAGQIALPNGKVVNRPQKTISADNVTSLDALAVWQLPGQVSQVLFSPDGNTVFAAVGAPKSSAKGQLYRWSLNDTKGPQIMANTQGSINTLFLSPDQRYLVYGTQGNELVMYDLQEDKAGPNLLGSGRGVTAAAISPDGSLLVWGLFEDYPYYQYLNGTQTGKFGYRLGTTNGMAFSADGEEVFMARDDGSVFVVDTSGWQLLKSIPVADAGKEHLGWMESSPDGNMIAVSGKDHGTLWVIDAASYDPVIQLQSGYGFNQGAFSNDGQLILIGNNNNSVSVVTLANKKIQGALKLADSPVLSVAISPDGALMAIGDRNGMVRLLAPKAMLNAEALPGAKPAP